MRKQLLPHAQRVETGIFGIMGKLPLTDETRSLVAYARLDRVSHLHLRGGNRRKNDLDDPEKSPQAARVDVLRHHGQDVHLARRGLFRSREDLVA